MEETRQSSMELRMELGRAQLELWSMVRLVDESVKKISLPCEVECGRILENDETVYQAAIIVINLRPVVGILQNKLDILSDTLKNFQEQEEECKKLKSKFFNIS